MLWGLALNLCYGNWSGRWESNPRPKLGKLLYCHCTTPARFFSVLIIHNRATASIERPFFLFSKTSILSPISMETPLRTRLSGISPVDLAPATTFGDLQARELAAFRERCPLTSTDKTLHLTPRATDSGDEHTQARLEVAGSSPVVPAIPSEQSEGVSDSRVVEFRPVRRCFPAIPNH